MQAHDREPVVAKHRRSEWTIVLVAALVVCVGFGLSGSLARRPVVVALDVVLTLIAVGVGVLTWRDAPRIAIVRVLAFAAAPPVVVAGIWLWLSRDVTLIGEGYADTIYAMCLYMAACVGFIATLTTGNVIAEKVTLARGDGDAHWVRRAAHLALALLAIVTLLGTHATLRRPAYEQWCTSLPLRADFSVPEAWPDAAWTTVTLSRGEVMTYRDLVVDGRLLRVTQRWSVGRYSSRGIQVCWLTASFRGTPAEWSTSPHDCSRSSHPGWTPLRVRRDRGRGLWIIDRGDRHDSAAFDDRGARVGPTYASILSSAAPPVSWVVAACVALLLALALTRRARLSTEASLGSPYRASPAAVGPTDPAELRAAFALMICAVHAAPLAAYFLRAAIG